MMTPYPLPDDLSKWYESVHKRRLAEERMTIVVDALILAVLIGGAILALHYTLAR